MPTYESPYATLDAHYWSATANVDAFYFDSDWTEVQAHYFQSDWAVTSGTFKRPGGFLTWTVKRPNGTTEVHACKICETVEGVVRSDIPFNSTSRVSKRRRGLPTSDVTLSPYYRSPSAYITTPNKEFRVTALGNELSHFAFDGYSVSESKRRIKSQNQPLIQSSFSIQDGYGMVSAYLENGSILMQQYEEALNNSSSSESSSSQSSISSSSQSSFSFSSLTSSVSSRSSSDSSRSSLSSSSFLCPNNIASITTTIRGDIVFTSDSMLACRINGGVVQNKYLALYTGDTTGKTYDNNRVFWGDTSNGLVTSNGFISMIINGSTYYVQVFAGNVRLSNPCCSNLVGSYEILGTFVEAGFALVYVNSTDLRYIQVFTKV